MGRELSAETPLQAVSAAHMPADWYALYTTARHEKRIAERFEATGVDYFLPLYRAQHKWKNGCKVTVELPLFPGYIFVHISRLQRVTVLESPGAVRLVGSAGQPLPISATDIESLRAGVHLRWAEPHPYLVIGDRVRITTGPLCGMEGILVRKKNNLRVVITLDHIMQSIAVEVNGDEVEPVMRRHQ